MNSSIGFAVTSKAPGSSTNATAFAYTDKSIENDGCDPLCLSNAAAESIVAVSDLKVEVPGVNLYDAGTVSDIEQGLAKLFIKTKLASRIGKPLQRKDGNRAFIVFRNELARVKPDLGFVELQKLAGKMWKTLAASRRLAKMAKL